VNFKNRRDVAGSAVLTASRA